MNAMFPPARGKFIDIKAHDGGSFRAYMAVPASGSGPGLVILQEIFGINPFLKATADRYAEEGYVAIVPDLFWRMEPGVELGYDEESFGKAFGFYQKFDVDQGVKDIDATVKALKARPECTGKVAALGFCLGGKLAYLTAARCDVDAAVSYYGVAIEQKLDEVGNIKCPMVLHFAEADKFVPPEAVSKIRDAFKARDDVRIYVYPGLDHAFSTPGRQSYDKPATQMAYSRSLKVLRDTMGPQYDLEALWDQHTALEFGIRDAAATMKTMVDEPYVNHVPTLTGGVGQQYLHRFYHYHFIPKCPKDTKLTPVSRTVGTDRLVDEMIFSFTHDEVIDWLLPGVQPTGKFVEVPLVAIINFRGDKLYHEHIYWDQASVLKQIGLLNDPKLPVAGPESAKKVVDEHSVPSNEMMPNWSESEGKPL